MAGARGVAALDRWTPHRSSRRSWRIAHATTQRRPVLSGYNMLYVQSLKNARKRRSKADKLRDQTQDCRLDPLEMALDTK